MSLRDTLHNKPVVGVLVVLVLVAAAASLMMRGGGNGGPGVTVASEYFLDLSNGKLFPRQIDQPGSGRDSVPVILDPPPIDAPGGAGMGVRAYVYSCGSCASEKKIVYIEKLTDKARKLVLEPSGRPAQDASVIQTGKRVAEWSEGQKPDWIEATSEKGLALIATPNILCGGQPATRCLP